MEPPAKTPDQAGLDRRAKLAIAACVVLPVLIGVIVTAGTFRPAPAPPPPMVGHWVYVESLGAAVHVDGGNKKVDASVHVGSASSDSLVVQDRHANYLVDFDKTIVFSRTGVTDHKPSAGIGEAPVAVAAAGNGYLVYRSAAMIVSLGSQQQIPTNGKVGEPVMTPTGELWVNRPDTGDICVLETTLQCKLKTPDQGALTLLNGKPVFVDTDKNTWLPVTTRDHRPTDLGVDLPDNALVGGSSVDGRIPVIDPAGRRLLLIGADGDVKTAALGPGQYDRPYSAGDAVAVVDTNTGKVRSFDAAGNPRDTKILDPHAHMTQGDDGRVYVDATDGLQSVVMDPDGKLTPVPTSDQTPPVYKEAAATTTPSVAPAPITTTTTETIPAAPDTVTVQVTPTSTGGGTESGTAAGGGSSSTKPKDPTSTKPLPGAPGPTVDVLGATDLGGGKARVRVSVRGGGAAFCHVFFNSVERAATKCTGETDITATGIPPHQLYDVHVLGVNDKGTGNPGRRVQLAM